MARKRRRRGRLFVPRMSESLALGTLASNDVIGSNFAHAVNNDVWCVSMDAICSAHGHSAGEGPYIVGVAHGDYTDAEIEEWFEATGSWDQGDKIANEQARRKCRVIGIFNGNTSEETLFDGKPKRVKLGFKLQAGQYLKLWCYNESTGAFTTGTIVELKGPIYLKFI